ncbi:MAG: hypothetical protein HC851_20025 [Acaryochloris sp. RU_4_1]|nr:hypothetical protein [Acaryochloris sp. RU_4_1]NJR55057.1 hypothetical protein [Acaryochloris sp. CRU_2_0]
MLLKAKDNSKTRFCVGAKASWRFPPTSFGSHSRPIHPHRIDGWGIPLIHLKQQKLERSLQLLS